VAQSNSLEPVAFRDGRRVQESQVRRPVVARFGTNEAQGRPPLHSIAPLPQRLLTTREVAAHLRVSAATIYRLVERGELRCVRVGVDTTAVTS